MLSITKNIETAKADINADAKAQAARQHNNSVMSLAREGASMYAAGTATQDRGLSITTGALCITYQTDEYMRKQIDQYLLTRGEGVDKAAKDKADAWFADVFDMVKPNFREAKPTVRSTYNNRVKAFTLAMERATIVHAKGYVVTQDAKDKKKFLVTCASYRKVTGDKDAKEDVVISDKSHAGTTMVKWANIGRPDNAPKKAKGKKGNITVSQGNVATLCNAIATAFDKDKGINVEKLTGNDQLALMKAWFTLGNAIGSTAYKSDKAMLDKYDALVKAQAA